MATRDKIICATVFFVCLFASWGALVFVGKAPADAFVAFLSTTLAGGCAAFLALLKPDAKPDTVVRSNLDAFPVYLPSSAVSPATAATPAAAPVDSGASSSPAPAQAPDAPAAPSQPSAASGATSAAVLKPTLTATAPQEAANA